MTTTQSDTNLLTDEQLDTVAAGGLRVRQIDVGPIVEPRPGFSDVCDVGTAWMRLGFANPRVSNGRNGIRVGDVVDDF